MLRIQREKRKKLRAAAAAAASVTAMSKVLFRSREPGLKGRGESERAS